MLHVLLYPKVEQVLLLRRSMVDEAVVRWTGQVGEAWYFGLHEGRRGDIADNFPAIDQSETNSAG